MRTLLVMLIGFHFLVNNINAQNFSFRTNIGHHQFSGMGLEVFDSNIVMYGFGQQYLGSGINKTFYANFDFNGNLLNRIMLDSSSNSFSQPFDRSTSKLNDSIFISVINIVDTFNCSEILTLDKQLDIKRNIRFRNPEVSTGDSDFFMKVYRKGATDYIQTSQFDYSENEMDVNIYKFDTSGVLMDALKLGEPGVWNRANSMVPTNHNTFIIGSSKQKPQPATGSDWSHTWIIEIDTNLNIIREWTDGNDSTYEAVNLRDLVGGGLIYSTVKKVEDFGFGDISWELIICRLDNNWENKLWEYKFEYSDKNVINQMKFSSDGNIVAVGKILQKGDSVNFYNMGGLVLKISPEGTLLWKREYYPINDTLENESILWDFDFLPDGDIMAAGWSLNFRNSAPETEKFNGWLLRLDSYGCLEPGCEYADAISEVKDENLLNIYPNPGGPVLNIQTNGKCYEANYTCLVTDMQGRLVQHSFALKPSAIFQVNAQNWSSGMYFVHLIKDGKRVNSFKWVK